MVSFTLIPDTGVKDTTTACTFGGIMHILSTVGYSLCTKRALYVRGQYRLQVAGLAPENTKAC